MAKENGYSRFVLVVRWNPDEVAVERIGAFCIDEFMSKEARLGPMGEDTWEWRRIRLI